jgi:hypothetical protein
MIIPGRVPGHQQSLRACLWRQLLRRNEEKKEQVWHVNFQAESAAPPPGAAGAAGLDQAVISTYPYPIWSLSHLASQALAPDTKDSKL